MIETRQRQRSDIVTLSDGAQIFLRLSGLQNPGPPLVFLHGNRDNHTHFTELIDGLDSRFPCAAVDLRGHGLSSKEDHPLSAAQCVNDLLEVLDSRDWHEVTLVGHSLGSVTALLFAIQHPQRMRRLVVIGAAAHYEMKWKRPEVSEETYRQVVSESNKRAAPHFFLEQYPEVARRVIASWSWVPYSVHKNLINLVHPDLREEVRRISAPTLVVVGSLDRSTPVESARLLADNIPNAELLVVDDTGHFVFMEEPSTVATAIAAFLGQ
jgi:pimeloyl-ACP methyl ester carboxylesterase